jgi:hypothetical protein
VFLEEEVAEQESDEEIGGYCRVKMPRGKVIHEVVSVMAVNTQLSSPRGVCRSLRSPGSCMTVSGVMLFRSWCVVRKYRSTMSMGDMLGVVKVREDDDNSTATHM